MRRILLGVLVLTVALVVGVLPLVAHHSFAAEFDVNQPVTLKGVVTKVEWMNPHIYVYIDVKPDNNKVEHWALEGGPPNTLYRNGWRKDSLKLGDTVTVEAYRAKDQSTTANVRTVVLPDGRSVFAGSTDDGGPKSVPSR